MTTIVVMANFDEWCCIPHGGVVYLLHATGSQMKHNQLGCPIGTLPRNRAQSLPSDRVEVSIVTEQL